MPAPRKYSTRTRAKAVGIAIVDGVTAAERQTGIPKTTIQDWTTRPEYVHLRTTAREVVVADLWLGLQIGVRELTKGLEGDAPLHHKAAAFGALAERYALLNGDPTARTENKSITDTLDDHESDILNDVILGELGRRSDTRTVEFAVATPEPTGSTTT